MGDLVSNIKLFEDGLLRGKKPVVIAGIGYWTPWTRDAAINCSNAVSLLFADVAKNTLLSVLENNNGKIYIGGEYWDKIIWAIGAWEQYLTTGDDDFLRLAYEAVVNTIEYMEQTEFDKEKNLFRGPACYGDGVAAYPDIYASTGESGIISFARQRHDLCADTGIGIPMFTLSANCLYYRAYIIADLMADELKTEKKYEKKAAVLKATINDLFYMKDKGFYKYIIDDFGGCEYQEGMGNSFAILFGIANEYQAQKILSSLRLTNNGIACVMPSFSRYTQRAGHYGRHSGTVWPHIEAFFADAALMSGRNDLFENELWLMAERAVRDGHFAEIYHPDTGEIYGGLQEKDQSGIVLWKSEQKQTWSATGFLRLMFKGILGLRITSNGIQLSPFLPQGITRASFSGIRIKNIALNVSVYGNGGNIESLTVNGEQASSCFLSAEYSGEYNIKIVLSESDK